MSSSSNTSSNASSETREEKECCICFETIGCKNNCVTPCGHSFCFNCVTRALTQNNTCPICRTVLIEVEEEEDSDYDDEEEEEDSDGEEEEEEEQDDCGIDEITSRFLKLGYTTMDVMSMLTGRYKRSDPKNTKEYIQKMIHDFEDIVDEVDGEEDERESMAEEDRQPELEVASALEV
jgi:hypothetical protein